MAGNRAVAYAGPGRVTVETIDYPKLELQDGPRRQPGEHRAQMPARGDPQGRLDQHLRQ